VLIGGKIRENFVFLNKKGTFVQDLSQLKGCNTDFYEIDNCNVIDKNKKEFLKEKTKFRLADLFNTSGKQYSLQYFIQPPL
jgi:hypothetical protein